jgi:serine protease Do
VAATQPEITKDRSNPLGFRVTELSEETRQVAGIKGVRIAELNEGPGRDAGLLVGDVVVALNRQEISSSTEFSSVANNLPESGFIPIRIIREGQGTTMALELSP